MWKRDKKLFAHCLLNVLVTGVLLLTGCAAAFFLATQSGASKKPLELALVNEDGDGALQNIILAVIAGNEEISDAVDVRICGTEKEAVEAVKAGASAALIIPDGFFGSIYAGKNSPCTLILNDADISSAGAIREYTNLGSDLLSKAQCVIYAGDAYLADLGAGDEERSAYNRQLNLSLLGEAADAAESYFFVLDVGYTSEGLSETGHYLAAFLGFALAVLGVCFYPLYTTDVRTDRLRRLLSAGVTRRSFFVWKILLPAALYMGIIMAVILVLATGADVAPALSSLKAPVLSFSTIASAVCAALFAAAFCAFLGAVLGKSSAAATFLIFFVSLFFIGGIIPYSALPNEVLSVGQLTPLGVLYSLLSPLFGGALNIWTLPFAALYLLAGCIASHSALKKCVIGRGTA